MFQIEICSNWNFFIHFSRFRCERHRALLTGWDFGLGLGILLGGIFAEHVGYNAVFLSIAAVHVVGVVLFFAATRKDFLRNRLR